VIAQPMGAVGATWLTGGLCFTLAAIALSRLPETFGCDLNYIES